MSTLQPPAPGEDTELLRPHGRPLTRTRLPSTMSLIVFEAVARHLSFTRAGIELNLSQTAVSHQIRKMEEMLGIRLFDRTGNNVKLTDVAAEYLQTVRQSLIALSAATDRAAQSNDENVLTIQCLGTFAIKRLIPALPRFRALYPSIALKLMTVQAFQPLGPHGFDIGIWHGDGDWPALSAEKLGEEEIFPVCSPALRDAERLRVPDDLAGKTIIRTSSTILSDDWPFWLDHAGIPDIAFGLEFTSDYLVTSMQAAMDGLGIALALSGVVADDLKSGRLVEPFSIRAPSKAAYFVVSPPGASKLRKAQLFRQWVLDTLAD